MFSVMTTISGAIGLLHGNNLRAKSARGVMALSIGMVAGYGMKFVRRMILARILAPSEIGMMAIIFSLSLAFEAFTEVGVKQSVIQNKRGAEPGYINAAWWMQVIRGSGLFLIAFLAAPWISSFYDKPKLVNLLRVAFLAVLFKGLVSPRAYVLEKEYTFGRAVFLTQASAILGTIITIILAFMIRNIWALVVGFLAEMAILCVLSFILVPFLPRLRIERECLGQLMRFALGVLGLPILTMISIHAPVLVLGKVITEDQLGLYFYAAMLAFFPIDLYRKIISPVLLPVFSEKQDDKESLRHVVLEITQWTAVFCVPLIAFMSSCAGAILLLVYSPEYAAMAIPFVILCFYILSRTQGVILASIYLALGRPHLLRRFVTLQAAIIVGLIYPAVVYFGPRGAAIVFVLGNFAALVAQILHCGKVIDLKFSRYMRSYIPGLLLGLPVITIVGLLRLLGIDSAIVVLITGALAFVATSLAAILILKPVRKSSAIEKEYENKLDYLSAAGS